MRIAEEARTISRYGLRGSRVGEASNPGPPHLRRLRRASQSRIGQSPVSSDEEVLVHANTGRDVLPTDAIQQTLIDTDSEDGRPLLQLELPREVDLVGNVACDPISADGGPRHQGASRRVALVPQSSQGTPRSIQDQESLWTPVSLSNRFAALDENSRPEVHVMSEGADEAASTASDTESLVCEPRVRLRRLSLVWEVGPTHTQPTNQESPCQTVMRTGWDE